MRHSRRPPNRAAALLALVAIAVVVLVVIGLASNGGGNGSNASSTTTPGQTAKNKKSKSKRKKKPAASTPTRVRLKITPTVPTYMCIDRGQGTTPIYQGITAEVQTFRGKHLRVNLGKTSVTITANGKRVPLTIGPNPAGIDFTPGKHKDIPAGKRPCA